ncbi:hypothetical protein CFC21_054904 [Triticum aestivum]|uniref:Uncharacterized protein n=3 Tax=Triticum TaxID=4564 RepID=A0A9R0W5T1_TRITD|nr:uncharacterized protein LOC123083120 [Triticum aestivum]KAF7045840.1 hypothetical protein CFC21_054904 [Triticum aestivum]VAH97877.1 unnamed protein product [Triticum turgidum subsp. durum]
MDRRATLAAPSIRVKIPDQLPTLFEPQKATPYPRTTRYGSTAEAEADGDAPPSPEHCLTVLALQLAVLEKAATGLGTLAFVWATVVLLGGFAITLDRTDFWCITGLLLIEGTRILGRSHELEWQHHQASQARSATRAAVPAFFWMQLLSATACVSLSLVRLIHQHYGGTEDARSNRAAALNIFYGLSLAEALLFLVEKALWEWKVGHRRLLQCVADDCNLAGAYGQVAVRRFFYDSYSRCLNGSILDGLHMCLVSYADDLITAGSHDEQSLGAGILVALAESDRFAEATLRRIGVSAPTIERLIEMLSWKDSSERDVRRSAAVVVSMLTGRKLVALRITGIPGAIESVASLLYADLDELNILGLSILNKLAHDHDNCDKIGKTRGLLEKIISYSSIDHALASTTPRDMRLKAVKKSLRVVKRLAGATGDTGKLLRRELTEIVFTVSNVREILQRHDKKVQSELHQLAIEILTSLAMDEETREIIGGTGDVVSVLVTTFLPGAFAKECQQADAVRVEAGEALAILALENKKNCAAIIMALGGGIGLLVDALNDPLVVVGAARIMHNLCSYSGDEWQLPLRRVTVSAAKVLRSITVEKGKILNIFIGLAAQMLRFMEPGELRGSLDAARVVDTVLARSLVQVLREYSRPSMDVPRARRYTIELAISLMQSDARYVALFVELGMESELRRVAMTTSQLECFNVFSGSVGLSRRDTSVCSLVKSALELMNKGWN